MTVQFTQFIMKKSGLDLSMQSRTAKLSMCTTMQFPKKERGHGIGVAVLDEFKNLYKDKKIFLAIEQLEEENASTKNSE